MSRISKLVAVAALLALAFGPGRALAATGVTATLPVQASVTSGCLIGTIGINFGAVSPLLVEEDIPAPYTSEGAIELACGTNGPTSGSFINISLDTGANGAVAPILDIGTSATAVFAMTNGTSFLAYDLFQPGTTSGVFSPGNCTTLEWGSGLVGAGSGVTISAAAYAANIAVTPGSAAVVVPVCGSIPADQVQPLTPGIYTDTVTATVTF